MTRAQALACGVPPKTLDTWVERGRWRALLPAVYDAAPAHTGTRQLLRAAVLYGGPTAVVDGLTAAHLHGLRLPPRSEVEIAVAPERRIGSRSFLVVRHTVHRPRLARAGLPLLAVANSAVIAAIRLGDERAARALLAEAVQRRLTTPERLEAAAAVAPRHGRAVVNAALEDIVAGCRSAPEGSFRRLVLTSRVLPEPLWNPLLLLPDGGYVSPDAYWPEAALVHETDSREHHLYGTAWESTMQRHGRFTAAGLTALHSSPWRIDRDGPRLLHEVEASYFIGRERGPAPGVAVVRRAA